MITCPNCLKKLNDGTHYCDDCGFDLLIELPDSPRAAAINNEEPAPANEEIADAATDESADAADTEEASEAADEYDFLNIDGEGDDMPYDRVKSKKRNSRKVRRFDKKKTMKAIAISMASLIFVSAVLVTLAIVFAEKVYPGYVLYVKDDELIYTSLDGSTLVTLPVYPEDVEDFNLFGSLCRLSDDGTALIFPQEYSYGDSSIDLCYINFQLPNAAPITIGYNAIAYSVNKDADTITYLREHDDGNKLFRYTTYNNGRIQIAENVDRFIASDDGESVIFYESNSSVFVYDGDKSTQLATHSTIAWGADESMYFFREENDCNSLYYFNGKQSIKLINDCYEIIQFIDATYGALILAEDDGNEVVYYVVGDTATKLPIEDMDYFLNYFWVDEDGKTMYYLDEVDENDSDDYGNPEVVFEGLLYHVVLTEEGIELIEEIAEDVNDGFFFGKGQFFHTKKTDLSGDAPTFELYLNNEYVDELVSGVLHVDGDDVYCIANYDKYANTFSIYRNGKRIADDVIETKLIKKKLMYIKESEEYYDQHDLYDIDGNLVAGNMMFYDSTHKDKVIFFSEFDEYEEFGTLCVYDGKTVTELGDDIFTYNVTLSGNLVYVKDVESTGSSDIYYLNDGVERRIEKDCDVNYLYIMDCIGILRDSNYVDVEEANYLAESYYE